MRRAPALLLPLLMILGSLVPATAHSFLIMVNFSFQYDRRDPVNAGQTASGYFSFDSSLLPSPGQTVHNYVGLGATSVEFTLDGRTWTRSDADLTSLSYDLWPSDSGELVRVIEWSLDSLPPDWRVIPMFDLLGHGPIDPVPGPVPWAMFLEFHYSTVNSPEVGGLFMGNGRWTVSLLPEPGTLVMIGLGLLGVGLIRGRMA